MKHITSGHSRLLVLLGAVLSLAACGGSAPPAASAPPASAATQASAASATGAAAKPAGSPSAPASAKPAASAKPGASAKPSALVVPKAAAGTITVAAVGGSPSFSPIWAGVDNGLFEKYGAPVQLITTTAPPAMAALLNGDVQVAVDGGAMVGADTAGTKLAFIAAQQNAFNQFTVEAKASIKSLPELKGHTVGAASPGSAATVAFETILKSAGLDPKNDVKWAYLGTPAAQWAALEKGEIDAGIDAWPFNVLAREAGFIKLADGKEMKLAGASNTIGVSRAWVKANPKLVDGFLRALTEGAYIANTDKTKALASIKKHALVPQSNDAVLNEGFDRFAGTFPVPPYITKEAVQEAITDSPNPAVKQRKPEDYIDNAPLDAIVASGFTKQFAKA